VDINHSQPGSLTTDRVRAPPRPRRGPARGGALALLEDTFRAEWGQVLASLIGFLGDFDLAEEAVQDAFAIAAERWARDGVPTNPGGWLVATARNRAIDRIRRSRVLERKTRQLDVPQVTMDEFGESQITDERLELIFTCCHPSLPRQDRVALTLRALGGLTTGEIARAFLVTEEAMKRRLTRAKAKIKRERIAFAVPDPHELPYRLAGVLAVIYLIFNEGYGGRGELSAEALRLGVMLAALMPDEPEVHGLLALMHLNDARRRARFADRDLVLLADQDRSLWDQRKIAAGREALERAIALRGRGPYVLQAAIASLHAEPTIDWHEVVLLYDRLLELTGSAVVELNRAIAIAHARSNEEALEIVDDLQLAGYQYFHSTRGELLHRLGRNDQAKQEFLRALELAASDPERRFLQRRIAEL
jgi:RNA polymerase sigma-70 factor (ECF subfamily)